jgi:hypothetical protein
LVVPRRTDAIQPMPFPMMQKLVDEMSPESEHWRTEGTQRLENALALGKIAAISCHHAHRRRAIRHWFRAEPFRVAELPHE